MNRWMGCVIGLSAVCWPQWALGTVIVHITSGGLSELDVAPGGTIPFEISLTTTEPLISWQFNLIGNVGFSHPGVAQADYNNTLWDQNTGLAEPAGNLPMSPIGAIAQDLINGAGSGLALTSSLTAPLTDGSYTISAAELVFGDLSFGSIPLDEIFVEPLIVNVPEPAAILSAWLLLPLVRRRTIA